MMICLEIARLNLENRTKINIVFYYLEKITAGTWVLILAGRKYPLLIEGKMKSFEKP